jgi:hypothetical protein
MSKFLKAFAFGLLYIFLLPLLIMALVVYGVYGLVLWFILLIKGLIRFFKGDTFFAPFPEDEKVEEIRKAQIDLMANPTGAPTPTSPAGPSTVYVQQNYYQHQNGAQGTADPNANPNPNPTPIDSTGTFRPTDNIPGPTPATIDYSATATPGIPTQPAPSIEQQPTEPEISPRRDTKTVAIIDLSKIDDGKDDK